MSGRGDGDVSADVEGVDLESYRRQVREWLEANLDRPRPRGAEGPAGRADAH